eukprot:1802138-Pyramimonas_sp.AAC.1
MPAATFRSAAHAWFYTALSLSSIQRSRRAVVDELNLELRDMCLQAAEVLDGECPLREVSREHTKVSNTSYAI